MTDECLFELRSISKSYGATKALDKISVDIHPGEIVGLIGANGAGKSTLTRVISGVTVPDTGELIHLGKSIQLGTFNPAAASRLGVQVVYQELSLCTNLTVYENFFIDQYSSLKGVRNWRKRIFDRTLEALDEIFPEHGIDPSNRLGELPLSRRQMVEIARAASMRGLKLLILDEPTSSLGTTETKQLMKHLRSLAGRDVSIIFISHRLGEIIDIADRIVVMRNGKKVWEGANRDINQLSLVKWMTDEKNEESQQDLTITKRANNYNDNIFVRTNNLTGNGLGGLSTELHGGELVGIAGLDGNGQREFLKALFYTRGKSAGMVEKSGQMCYVTGDRKKEGIFPLWSIEDNMSIVEVNKSPLFGFLDLRTLALKVTLWYKNLEIKAETIKSPILSLSGGNQQKVLVARAFLSEADVIILDDPTKGVDIGTKRQMYTLFREAAEKGKLVIWYSTDDEELEYCSRVLVFRYGQIVEELNGHEISKNQIIEASFQGEDLLVRSETAKTKKPRSQSSIIIPLTAMLTVFIASGILQNGVFSRFGIDLLLSGSLPLIFAAMAQMFIIGLSHIDLSVGAYMGLINVLCATVLQQNTGLGFALIAATVIVYGVMGSIIYFRNIPSVVVTMGMSFVWTGIAYSLQEKPGGKAPEWLVRIFSLNLPVPQSILIVLVAGLAGFLFYRSKYGTVLRGFGNNPSAVERSGWSTLKAFVTGYVIASIFAIIGGFIITALTGASDANSTTSYTLLTVAAVVMGGSELVGGIVSPFGTIVGAITLSLVGALLGFMRLNSSYVTAVQGLIFITILASRLLRKVKI
jgi:ribose transport system ATP-binding protein